MHDEIAMFEIIENLVYNMIDAEMMKKSEDDRREHFDNVYDFDDVFETDLEINASAANL